MADNKDKKVLNVPALRFPEFNGEWITRPIKDIADFIGGGTPSSANEAYWQGTIPWVSSSDIVEDNINDITISRYITEEAISNSATKLCSAPVILIVSRVGVGKVALSSKAICTSQDFCNLINIKVHPTFLAYSLSQIMKRKSIEVQGTSIKGITSLEIQKIILHIPSLQEQHKISDLFQLIDKRIAVQSKIIEDLKKLKSAIVEMILCKQGGVLLKLGDVGSFIRGLTYSSEDIAEDINATTVIRANNLNYGNNVNKKDVVYVNKKPTEIQILRKGDIVICMANGSSSLVGKNSYYSFDDRQSTIGAFCGIYRSSQPLVKWLMQSQRYRRLVYQSLQGGNGAIANLNGDDILNMTFYVVEDKKSVSILSALVLIENSIAVNEKLQELYSMQKEYLLQHLFI